MRFSYSTVIGSLGFILLSVAATACSTGGLSGPGQCQGQVACFIYCEHGNALDKNGCPTCTCNPPPACPAIGCFRACEFGSRKDANGCETCDCLPPPSCLPVACDLWCPNGYKKDTQGCDTCACNSDFCPGEEPCDIDCAPYKRAPSGCQLCQCAPSQREPVGGQCIRNSNDRCTSDSDCITGGCGGEVCYNPNVSSGISTCECAPSGFSCGCVNGLCTHYR